MAKPPPGRPCSLLFEKEDSWRWESGKLALGVPLSHQPRRRSCGNVGISPAFGEISKGLVERGGSLLLAFHAFHSPGISIAHAPSGFRDASSPLHSPSPWLSACWCFLACSTR